MIPDNGIVDRTKGIGGSEAAAVLGLSPWHTPYQVWCDKTGEGEGQEERVRSPQQKWGLLLEPIIRQWYADETGRVVRNVGHLQSREYPFMLCSPDGVTDDGRLLEIKTAGYSRDWGEDGTDEIPVHYLIQVQHNLIVTGLEVADVPVLIAGSDSRIYEVRADRDLQRMIVEREAAFWRLVESRTPPEPISYSDAVKRFAVSRARAVEATPDVLLAVAALREIRAAIRDAERREEEAKLTVLRFMRDADTLVDSAGNVLVTCKQGKEVVRFDTKAFMEAHPDLYAQFCVAKPGSRPFLLKEERKG